MDDTSKIESNETPLTPEQQMFMDKICGHVINAEAAYKQRLWLQAIQHFTRVFDCWQEAEPQWHSQGTFDSLIKSLVLCGNIYGQLPEPQPQKAIHCYQQVLTYWQEAEPHWRSQSTFGFFLASLLNCGVTYAELNEPQPQKAIHCYQQVLAHWQEAEPQWLSQEAFEPLLKSLVFCGVAYSKLTESQPQQSITYLQQVVEYWQEAEPQWRSQRAFMPLLMSLVNLYYFYLQLPEPQPEQAIHCCFQILYAMQFSAGFFLGKTSALNHAPFYRMFSVFRRERTLHYVDYSQQWTVTGTLESWVVGSNFHRMEVQWSNGLTAARFQQELNFVTVKFISAEARVRMLQDFKSWHKVRSRLAQRLAVSEQSDYVLTRIFKEPQPFLPRRSLSPHQFEQYAVYYSAAVVHAHQRFADALSQSIKHAQGLTSVLTARAEAISVYNASPKPSGSGWHYQYKLSSAIERAKSHQQALRQFRKTFHQQSNQFVTQFAHIITERLAELFTDIVNVDAQSSSESMFLIELSCHYVGEESLAILLAVDEENKAATCEDSDWVDDWLMCISAQLEEVDVLTGAGIPAGKDMSIQQRQQWLKAKQQVMEEVIDNNGVMSLQSDIQTATLQARLLNTVKARLQSEAFDAIHEAARGELAAGNVDTMFTMWQRNQLGSELTEQLDSLLGKLQPSPILSLRSDYRDETVLEPASVEEVWQVMCHPASVRTGIQVHIKQWLEAYFAPLTWPELTTVDKAMSVRWLVLDVLLSTLLKQQVLHMPVDELTWLERRIPQWHMRWLRDKVYRPWSQETIKLEEAVTTLWHLFNYQTLPLDGLYAKPIDLYTNPTFEQACDVAKQLLASTHCVTRDIEGGEVDQWPIMDIWMSAFTGRREEYNLHCLDAFIRDKYKLPNQVDVQSKLPTFLQTEQYRSRQYAAQQGAERTDNVGLLDPIPTIDEVGNTLKPGQMMLLGVFTPQPDVSGPGVKYTEHTQHLHALCLSKPNDEVIAHYIELTTPDTCPNPDWHAELKDFWEAGVGKEEEKEEKEKEKEEEKSFASLLDSPPSIIQVVLSKLTELAKGLKTQNGPGELFVLWPAQVPLQWQELTHQGSLNLLPWEYWLQQQSDCKVRWHRMVSIAHYMERKKTPRDNVDAPTQQDATSSEPSWHFSGEQQLNDLHDAHLAVWPYEAHIEDKHNNTLLDLVACLAKPADGVFIGHGQYNPQAPSQSHLLLDRGGQLPAWMLPALTINTRNLNLTVCETATNANHHMAISNLFLRAGVQSTIATLWPVPALSNLLFNLLLKQSAKGQPITRAHMWTAKKHLSQLTKDEAEALINTLPDSSNSIKEALSALNAHCTKELVTQAPILEGKPLFNHPLYHAPYVWGE